ncbi:tRNA wybutosine-synthesizing protein 4 [Porphyridium purpureum]|uniref:[phosphatase 2A protein]-leucine-carboxy methyltransferase n=1 Tax=Porphyridium purpureum TaxID=35688 RepID=A0A5J4YPM8_PORPP|nr:tRNA wybutosine-synthesizing protein 4 [Porphyridium purpureum]|eukprot:POR2883..scf296_7
MNEEPAEGLRMAAHGSDRAANRPGSGAGFGGRFAGVQAAVGMRRPGAGEAEEAGAMRSTSRRGVVATNDDAVVGKWSAAQAGYYADPFLRHFLPPGDVAGLPKRGPLMNRGTYVRTFLVEAAVKRFLAAVTAVAAASAAESACCAQVVSLGAGFDTLYFRLVQAGVIDVHAHATRIKYVELDLPEVAKKKSALIESSPDLSACLHDYQSASAHMGTAVVDLPAERTRATSSDSGAVLQRTATYALACADMREPAKVKRLLLDDPQSGGLGLDPRAPTLFVTELLLIYLEPSESDALIRTLVGKPQSKSSTSSAATSSFSASAWLNLEQVEPNDAFGRTMLRNLSARKCALLGIDAYPTVESQRERFLKDDVGAFHHVRAETLLDAYRNAPAEWREAVEKLELLDEFEEWDLIMQHYAIVYAAKTAEEQSTEPQLLLSVFPPTEWPGILRLSAHSQKRGLRAVDVGAVCRRMVAAVNNQSKMDTRSARQTLTLANHGSRVPSGSLWQRCPVTNHLTKVSKRHVTYARWPVALSKVTVSFRDHSRHGPLPFK